MKKKSDIRWIWSFFWSDSIIKPGKMLRKGIENQTSMKLWLSAANMGFGSRLQLDESQIYQLRPLHVGGVWTLDIASPLGFQVSKWWRSVHNAKLRQFKPLWNIKNDTFVDEAKTC